MVFAALRMGEDARFPVTHAPTNVVQHNPRGSNNRNCDNVNNPDVENRDNGNRLFDSQNNDKGG